jgi:formylglycine-generating enzyme required for sulfatase activity
VPVRRYPPNAWGLYDMHGNAAEWCADPYRTVPVPPDAGPPAPGGDNEFRVARGGSWEAPAEECRSAYRWKRKGSGASSAIGFRVLIEQ